MKIIFSSWILLSDPNKFESNLDIISYVFDSLERDFTSALLNLCLKRQHRHSVIFRPSGRTLPKCMSNVFVFSEKTRVIPILALSRIILKHPAALMGEVFLSWPNHAILVKSCCEVFFSFEQIFLGAKWWDFSGGNMNWRIWSRETWCWNDRMIMI